jgi:hypothetical protein
MLLNIDMQVPNQALGAGWRPAVGPYTPAEFEQG